MKLSSKYVKEILEVKVVKNKYWARFKTHPRNRNLERNWVSQKWMTHDLLNRVSTWRV